VTDIHAGELDQAAELGPDGPAIELDPDAVDAIPSDVLAAIVVDQDAPVAADGAAPAAESAVDGPQESAAADPPVDGGALLYGTYALYQGDGGSLVLVVQDGATAEVKRFSAPALLVRTLSRRMGSLLLRAPLGG
jgi:hypothetical protein